MLFVCAAAALAAAVISGRSPLIAFAAPLLGVLCSAAWQRPPRRMDVHASPTLLRCFEGEREQIEVRLDGDPGDGAAALSVTAPDGMTIDPLDAEERRCAVAVSAPRWGRYPVRARLDVVAPGGLGEVAFSTGTFLLGPGSVHALPRAEAAALVAAGAVAEVTEGAREEQNLPVAMG